MAFTNSWVETDPDGSVITVSQLDNSDRLIKNAVRERLEGDPAVPDLTGLIEVGSFTSAPKPRKGAARVYVDTQANILAFGATKREDGRLAVASDTGRLFHVATAAVAAVKVDPGDIILGALAVTSLTAAAGAGSGTIKAGGVINANTTAVGNIGAGEDNLMTYALPANSLDTNGRSVRITMWGDFPSNANGKTLKVYFGTANLFSYALPTGQAAGWLVVITVINNTGLGQLTTFEVQGGSSARLIGSGNPTETTTASITIKATGTATADNDIVQRGMLTEFMN